MKFVLNGKNFKLVFDMSKINTRKKIRMPIFKLSDY